MTSGNPSFSQGEKYRYFVRTIARKIDENHPEAGAYDKLHPVYKDDDENPLDAPTEAPSVTPTFGGTKVLSLGQSDLTKSAEIIATQAQIAALTAQALTASGNQANSAFATPTGGGGNIISTPIPTQDASVTPPPTLMVRPLDTAVPGTDSVDINPLETSDTGVPTRGGIWDKIKKYLRELIIAAAGLVGIGAVWTLIRKRKRRPASS